MSEYISWSIDFLQVVRKYIGPENIGEVTKYNFSWKHPLSSMKIHSLVRSLYEREGGPDLPRGHVKFFEEIVERVLSKTEKEIKVLLILHELEK
jgi:hypothetical protein